MGSVGIYDVKFGSSLCCITWLRTLHTIVRVFPVCMLWRVGFAAVSCVGFLKVASRLLNVQANTFQ